MPEILIEAISKMHLTADGGVAHLWKVLTTCRGCCAFSSACALPSAVICYFWDGF